MTIGRRRIRGRSLKKGQEGFTLIETSIASLVFSVGVLAVGYLSIHSIQFLKNTADISMATNLASSTLEGLRVGLLPNGIVNPSNQLTFEQISGESLPHYFSRLGEYEASPDGSRYTVIWKATPDPAGNGVFTDVVVNTYWSNSGDAPSGPEDANHHITIRGRILVP